MSTRNRNRRTRTSTWRESMSTRTINYLAATSTMFTENDQSEMIRIDLFDPDEGVLYGTGEETEEQYVWNVSEINLNEASWWKLVPNV